MLPMRAASWMPMIAAVAACSFEPAQPADPMIGVDADRRVADAQVTTAQVDAACPGGDGDGDRLNDACDPCPDDADNDVDGDGVCGDVDDWPCGPRPSLPTFPSWNNGLLETVTVGHADIEDDGPIRLVAPGQVLTVRAGYSIFDCACTNCIDQIQVGLVAGGKQGCLYNGNPQCLSPAAGISTVTLVAPMAPGRYDLRFRRGNDTTCGTGADWWDNVVPDANTTFGAICVR